MRLTRASGYSTLGAEIVPRFHTAEGVRNSKSEIRTFGESLTKSDQPYPRTRTLLVLIGPLFAWAFLLLQVSREFSRAGPIDPREM